MAKNASSVLLVSLFMFGLLSCAIKGGHPFEWTDSDNGSSSDNGGSSSDSDDSSDGEPIRPIRLGTCYDSCPSGTCEDNHNCYCSSKYDANSPFCLPKIKELDSDDDETSAGDGYSGDDEAETSNSSDDSSSN